MSDALIGVDLRVVLLGERALPCFRRQGVHSFLVLLGKPEPEDQIDETGWEVAFVGTHYAGEDIHLALQGG